MQLELIFCRLRRAIFEINRNKITMSCQHSWDFTAWISYFHRQYCLKGMSLLLTWGGLRILKLMEIRRTESYFWKVRTLISIRTRRTIRQHEIWWQTQGEGDPARVSWTLFEMWCLKLGNVPKPSYRWCNNGNRAVGAGKSWKTGFWRGVLKTWTPPPRGGGVSAEINGNKNISRKLTEIRVYGTVEVWADESMVS